MIGELESADLAGFDAVIHLAAVCNDPVGNLNPQATYDIDDHLVFGAGGGGRRRRPESRVRSLLQLYRPGGRRRDAR